jgi:hypothetical protein
MIKSHPITPLVWPKLGEILYCCMREFESTAAEGFAIGRICLFDSAFHKL